MCDLIDLKSPEVKTISGTKLASPLIPVPSQASNDVKNDITDSSSPSVGLNYEKRNSLDNNPFDNAHHKTVEYARKREDPFEIALEKALSYEARKSKSSSSKARNVEFKDDFTPKKRRYSDILKMNKTLDDSIANLAAKKVQLTLDSKLEPIRDSRESDAANEAKLNLQNGQIIPRLRVEAVALDSSILNQSAMNDSLSESSGSGSSGGANENLLKSVMSLRIEEKIRCSAEEPNFLAATETISKLQKHRRSMSQGDRRSPRKFRQQRSRSSVDEPKIGRSSDETSSTIPPSSIIFEDDMNKAFLQTLSADNASVLSNLSNVSSITRLTSVSSALNSTNSSSVFSNRTANCAFIESSLSDGTAENFRAIADGKIFDKRRSRSNDSSSSVTKSPIKEKSRDEKDLNDLISKYSKLRMKSFESPANETLALSRATSDIGVFGISDDKSNCRKTEEKLIDVDVFVPESSESPDSQPRKSISGTSSDSVFVDNETIEKSIFYEAKTLAKTFEELASKTGSSSISSDDLINSRPGRSFDLLPVSDDDVEDLIELKKSPGKSDAENANDPEESKVSASSSDGKSEGSMLRELETNFKDPENKIIASSLLLDLEKLVKSENNSEAAELLKSLEKALGVRCGSNVDLLTACLSVRNDLTKSPKRSANATEINENIRDDNIEKSREDNSDIVENPASRRSATSPSNDRSLENNFNVDKEIKKSDKSPILVDREMYEDLPIDERQIFDLSSVKDHDDSIEASKQRNFITNEQKMAVKLLVGLGKLLTGEKKDPATTCLLKNLGIALNLAMSENCDHVNEPRTSYAETKRASTPVKNRLATPPRNKSTPISASSRAANRRSLELSSKAKTTDERGTMRRSFSVTHTPIIATPNTPPRLFNAPLSAEKSKPQLKDGRKRFSSDPSSDVQLINGRKLTKDITLKPVSVSEFSRQDKSSSTLIGSVKNKFRKKTEPDFASKKGPMKAILPLGNMQRRGSSVKRESTLNGSVTPPKPGHETALTVTTSTPFPSVNLSAPLKKSPKSKPMASSTPDDAGTKYFRRSASSIPQSPGRNTLLCNISPVTSKTSKNNEADSSHNNSTSSTTSKIVTPSKSRQRSQLPRLSPVPVTKNSSPKSNRERRLAGSQSSFLPKFFGTPPRSSGEILAGDGSTSPLNISNKHGSTVKPMNLISKLGRRKRSVAEKENYA